jgi:hypothetical protein
MTPCESGRNESTPERSDLSDIRVAGLKLTGVLETRPELCFTNKTCCLWVEDANSPWALAQIDSVLSDIELPNAGGDTIPLNDTILVS